jgi:hypothetical protein
MAFMTEWATQVDEVVLEGVPKIGYSVHMCPFPGALYACMEYLGDPCDYDYLMGVTGAAFRRLWNRDDGGNVDLMHLAPEPERRAFRALGYSYTAIPRTDKRALITAIKESIGRGRPAISFGIIGPPEAGLVTGYAEDGEVLYGYSYFQDLALDGYYEKDDWFETMAPGTPYGLIVVGDKLADRPDERTLLRETLAWASRLAEQPRRPELPEHLSGLEAYIAWAAALEVDADYPATDSAALSMRLMIHADQVTMLSERRSAAAYLRQMVTVAPECATQLNQAAAHYEAAAAYESQVWPWGYAMGLEEAHALADPCTRRVIAKAVREAGVEEICAVAQLDQVLEAMRRA